MVSSKINSLDGFRALSIMMVVGGHLSGSSTVDGPLKSILLFFDGSLGVRCFFVVSGFLITFLLLEERRDTGSISISSFYNRRALRLFPVYYTFLIFLAIMDASDFYAIGGCGYLTALFFMKNYACGQWVDGHLWSLAVEWQFYIIWPLLIKFFPPKMILILCYVSFVVAPVSRAVEYQLGARTFFWLSSNIDALLVGGSLAYLCHFRRDVIATISRRRPYLVPLAILAMAIAPILGAHLLFGKFTVTIGPLLQSLSMAYLILYYIENSSGVIFKALNSRLAVKVGVISYSLYVWQQPFLASPLHYPALSNLLVFPLNLFIAVSAALASYYVLEVPVQSWRASLRNARSKVINDTKPPLFSGSTQT